MSLRSAVFAISLCLGGQLAFAQVTTGTISGIVQDASGAALVGAAVTIRNLDTGAIRTVMTDTGGRYKRLTYR